MENSIWYNEHNDHLNSIIERFSKAELTKYKIGQLFRLMRKVDEYSESCPICSELKAIIETLILELDSLHTIDSVHNIDSYNAQLLSLHKHLKTAHHVVAVKHYMHLCVILGVIVGLIVSLLFMNVSEEVEKYGFWGVILIGYLIGRQLDVKATSEGRVLE